MPSVLFVCFNVCLFVVYCLFVCLFVNKLWGIELLYLIYEDAREIPII